MGNVVATVLRTYQFSPNEQGRLVRLGFTGTYATAGDTLDAATIKKLMPSGTLANMATPGQLTSKLGRVAYLDQATNKLKVYVPMAVYTAVFNPASLAAITSRDDAVTVTGVLATDEVVRVEPPAAILSSVVVQGARVTGADTITMRLTNPSAGAVDVASGTWKFYVAAAGGAMHEVPSASDLTADTFDIFCRYEEVHFANA